MIQKEENLVLKSIEIENDFSSTKHSIDTMVCEITKGTTNFTIPLKYNKDYLRLLPINTSTYFIYWELSDKLIKTHQLNNKEESLFFKVNDLENNTLYEFTSNSTLGEFFLNQSFENKDIYIKLGFIRDNKFIELLTSNIIHTFSTKLKWPTSESEVWVKKEKGWTEIIRSTMYHSTLHISSAKYVKEMERLKQFSKVEEEKFSSLTTHKGDLND